MTSADPTSAPRSACRSVRAVVIFLLVFGTGLLGDLALKAWAFDHIGPAPVDIPATLAGYEPLPGETITLIPNVLALKLTLNTGAVFGLGSGYRIVFMLATVLAIGVVGFFFCTSRAHQWAMHAALGMVLAGALGNFYDRWAYHAVRDMLWLFPDVHLPFGLTWPGGIPDIYPWIFNIADVLLLIGIAVLVIRSFFVPEGNGTQRDASSQSSAAASRHH